MKKVIVISLVLFFFNGYLPCFEGIQERTFTPGAVTRLCPDHIGGDREFNGHGPRVKASATLDIRRDRKEIWVDIYLHVIETRSDWTEAEGTWERRLWTAPSGYRISYIDSDYSSEAYYTDTDHQLDNPAVRGGDLVSKFAIMGDTDGNDVGNCTSDDVYISVYFNEIRVMLERVE